jgi:hypothetical protein
MREIDLERASASAPRGRAYGTFSQSKEIGDVEKDMQYRSRERERGVLVGALVSAALSLVVLTTFVIVAITLGPGISMTS